MFEKGTTILAMRSESQIIIASDSMITSGEGYRLDCKLMHESGVYFATAGLRKYELTDFDVDTIASRAIQKGRTVEKSLRLFTKKVRPMLHGTLRVFRTEESEVFERSHLNKYPLSTVFGAFENGVPVIGFVRFFCLGLDDSDDSIVLRKIFHYTEREAISWAFGFNSEIRRYNSTQIDPNYWETDPIETATRLVKFEIEANSRDVSWPVHIVRITSDGAEQVTRERPNE